MSSEAASARRRAGHPPDPTASARVVLLAGGTGGAKLAAGMQAVLGPGRLTVIANTADDDTFWGLHVSPDLDSVVFRLAGIFNQEAGFGVAGETFNLLAMMRRLGEIDWFWLGDRDLAFHLLRTRLLAEGLRLSEVSLEICRRLGLGAVVLPMTDQPVRTRFDTSAGRLSFQEYFVREKLAPELRGIDFEGLAAARPSPEAVAAVRAASLVVIGPSNPVISIGPILRLLAPHLRRESTVAITPIVGGSALKGPTVEMMRSTGREPTVVGVAREYADLAGVFVIDQKDSEDRRAVAAIEAMRLRVVTMNTLMTGPERERELASAVVGLIHPGAGS